MIVNLLYAHWFPLTSQGNIYSLTTLKSTKGLNRVLIASMKRKIYSFEYHQHFKWCLKPLVKELLFTYIPNGAEIIAIDAFSKLNVDEFVIGITIIKPSGETSVERYLNIYTESPGEDLNSLEAIAQNCLMVELSYTPYLLYHTVIPDPIGNEIVWLISGNDCKIHLIKEDKKNHGYTESQLEKYFPEFDQLQRIGLWIDIYYYKDYNWRLSAISCECGFLKLAVVNVKTLEITKSWILRYDNPVCNVGIFPNYTDMRKPEFLNVDFAKEKELKLNIYLVTGNTIVVYEDLLHKGINSNFLLTGNDLTTDCILCSCVADINMDSQNEILLGTYRQEVLIFALVNNTWEMIDKKFFDAPVHSITYIDLAGDGVKVLVVLTQRSVHIMQHDSKDASIKWQDKFSKLKVLLEKTN